MIPRRYLRKLTAFWQAARMKIIIVLGLVALGWTYYFLATLGPRSVQPDPELAGLEGSGELASLAAEVAVLEARYHRAADAGLMTEDALDALVQAVEKQRLLVRGSPRIIYEDADRLLRLEIELGNARAPEMDRRIERLYKDGLEAMDGDRLADASRFLDEALNLQRELNAGNASAKFKNYGRETALAQAVAGIKAVPLVREKEAALTTANAAVAGKNWSVALAAFTAAREIQSRLNTEFADSRYADMAAYDRLTIEIESLNASGFAADVEAKETAGDEAARAGAHARAAELYAEAFGLQKEVNLKFPRSRFMSSQKLESLEVKRQTALSRPLARQLEELDVLINDDLRQRRVVAAGLRLPQAVDAATRLNAEFPKSLYVDGALRLKLSYLVFKKAEIAAIQAEVLDQLKPLPSGGLMLATETTQSLYYLVMNTNPSRNLGRTAPVESVNWHEAREFCMRLGWVLGGEVRLPTAEEFGSALSSGAGGVRSIENSESRTGAVTDREPNAPGFRDLLGNVAEWIQVPENDAFALAAGGSYLDLAATMTATTTERRDKTERAKHIGFRFVVRMPGR